MLQPRINYKLQTLDYWVLLTSFFRSNPDLSYLNQLFSEHDILFFDKARNGLRFILEIIAAPGTRVGVQPLTCPTVLEAIYLAKCKPIFIDISDNYLITENTLKKRIEDIDILIVTNTFGLTADTFSLKKILKEKILIEDCAHSFLSRTSSGGYSGANSDFALFSYGFGKFPTAISGGFICVKKGISSDFVEKYNNLLQKPKKIIIFINIMSAIILPILNSKLIYNIVTLKLKHVKNKKKYSLPIISKQNIYYFKSNIFVLTQQLKKISIYLQKQKKNGQILLHAVENNKVLFKVSEYSDLSNFFMLCMQVENSELFIHDCYEHGIEVGRHFVKTREIIDMYEYNIGDCPTYEYLIKNLVSLPVHYNFPDAKINLLAKIITNYKPTKK